MREGNRTKHAVILRCEPSSASLEGCRDGLAAHPSRRARARARMTVYLLRAVRLPDGQITDSLSSPFRKNNSVLFLRKSLPWLRHPVPLEGRIAIVTDVGAGCGGREERFDECADLADGEAVWSLCPALFVATLRMHETLARQGFMEVFRTIKKGRRKWAGR
jgi:hypothetical protein